jgi:hypothetical protein
MPKRSGGLLKSRETIDHPEERLTNQGNVGQSGSDPNNPALALVLALASAL